ncbi:tetratricopeptide repeat protein [Sphingobium sp. JS3065]|uniref:tetratricopeptide repeat protein n=1 Tax=Sphingobium sp. JS3065 TaxID=2970925 RepID=UPI002263E9F4|nr:tetratricopeptide repeat protein [Sphingobium sp. JS3065]UZW55448.1 tetratricopeptide repeat protein [Sphingobium sp. JS3065]
MNKGVVAVILIMATAACASPQKGVLSIRPVNQLGPAQDALARGDLLFSRGEYALALDAFRRAVRNDPADAHGLNGVAISYAAMGRHDLAREFFELALARAPQDARIARNFARSLSAQGLKGEAEALLAQAGAATTGMPVVARPTLAQLASAAPTPRPAQLAGVELERVSLGEVRLRTMDGPAPAERIKPQLTTRIVTVADAQGERELTAPIITVARPETDARPTLAGMAEAGPNAQASDDMFERLWKSIMRPAGRKGVRG